MDIMTHIWSLMQAYYIAMLTITFSPYSVNCFHGLIMKLFCWLCDSGLTVSSTVHTVDSDALIIFWHQGAEEHGALSAWMSDNISYAKRCRQVELWVAFIPVFCQYHLVATRGWSCSIWLLWIDVELVEFQSGNTLLFHSHLTLKTITTKGYGSDVFFFLTATTYSICEIILLYFCKL